MYPFWYRMSVDLGMVAVFYCRFPSINHLVSVAFTSVKSLFLRVLYCTVRFSFLFSSFPILVIMKFFFHGILGIGDVSGLHGFSLCLRRPTQLN